MSDKFVKTGTLTKQGNVRKSWKRRLFKLHCNGQLFYHKDPLKPALGSIDIKGQCIGLLRSYQCYCQWPANIPKPTCFGVMTPTRVYHLYSESAEDVDDWISIFRNTSDILRRQSSLTVDHAQLYENLQGISGAQEKEEDSDQDEISYEDVVRDADDDGMYATLPATAPKTATAAGVHSYPPLPPRVSASDRTSLADDVFQLADELADALAEDNAEEMLYESIPADQDVPSQPTDREHPKTPEVINPVFTADGVEEGDIYEEVATEKTHELYEQKELYDDVVASSEPKPSVPVPEPQIEEELYDDVAAPAAIQQVATVAIQYDIQAPSEVAVEEVYDDVAVSREDSGMQQADDVYDIVTDDHQEVTEELYDDVTHTQALVTTTVETVLDDSHQKDSVTGQQQEELHDDVAHAQAVIANTVEALGDSHQKGSVTGQQQEELYDAVESEQSIQEELYDEVAEVTEAARRHRESRNQSWAFKKDHEVEDNQVESRERVEEEVLVPIEAEQLAASPEQTAKAAGEYHRHLVTPVLTQDTEQDSAQDKQRAVVVSQVKKQTEPSMSASTRSSNSAMAPQEAATKPSQTPEPPTTRRSHEKSDAVSKNVDETSRDVSSYSSEVDVTRETAGSPVSTQVSAQEAGRRLKPSGKHNPRMRNGSAAEEKQTSELATTASVVRRAASRWSKSGSKLKEKDEKLRQSRALEEEAARQIAEWKAVHNRLFRKRGESSSHQEKTVETAKQVGGTTTPENKHGGTQGVKQNGGIDQPPSSDSRAKPTLPKKPTTIAAVAVQLKQKDQSHVEPAQYQADDNQRGKLSNDKGQQQQWMERKSQQHKEGTQHSATEQTKEQTAAGKQKESASTFGGDKSKPRDSEVIAKSGSNSPNTISSGFPKPPPPAKPQTLSRQVVQGCDTPGQSAASKPQVDSRTSAAVSSERQVDATKRPKLPAKPSTLPPRSSRSGMAAAVGLAVEQQKQLQEWKRKRREVFAAEKMRQERRGAEEKRRREEQAEQHRQLRILEAEKGRPTPVLSAGWKTESNVTGTVARAAAKVERSPASVSALPKEKAGVIGVIRQFEARQPPKKAQLPTQRVEVPVDEKDKPVGVAVNAATLGKEKAGDQSSKQAVMSHEAEVVQPHASDKTDPNSLAEIVTVPEKCEQEVPSHVAPIPTDKLLIRSAISQFESTGKQTSEKPDVTLNEDKKDLGERNPNDSHSEGLEGARSKAEETEANASRESAATTVLTNSGHVGNVPLPLTKSPTNAAPVVPSVLPDDSAVRKNRETIESDTSRAAESGRDDKVVSEQPADSLKKSSRNDDKDRPKYEPHLSEVQIREKKSTARRRAAALSWPMDKPPDDPLGAEGAELGDDDPLMLRKLSVVARGANAMAKALAAARWIDKEIRKLITEIRNWGSLNSNGKYEVTFGVLFEECSSIFEALSGTLRTAKKHGVVQFSGELLLQGVHNSVIVTLLKVSIPNSDADTYTYQQFRACSISVHKRKGKAFGNASQQTSQSKCFICGKTVYPMEYVSANDHAMHKNCFKCCDCGKKLAGSKYAALNDRFYCINHYEQRFKQQGGYGGFK